MIATSSCPIRQHAAGHAHCAVFFGARANYSRMRSIVRALHAAQSSAPYVTLIDTQQHTDPLLVGDGFGPAVNAAKVCLMPPSPTQDGITQAAYSYLQDHQECFDAVVVYGDTHSARGPADAAHELDMPIIHIEAGFRTYAPSGNRIESTMTEEVHRKHIDQIADYLIPFTATAQQELYRDHVPGYISEPTGHPLADNILQHAALFDATVPDPKTGLLTVHRRENLIGGQQSGLLQILDALAACPITWVFPAAPSALAVIRETGYTLPDTVTVIPPLSHDHMLRQLARSACVVTDSAGLSLEAALAGKPLVIPRDFVEFPELTTLGCIVRPYEVGDALRKVMAPAASAASPQSLRKLYSSGNTGDRIAAEVMRITSQLQAAKSLPV